MSKLINSSADIQALDYSLLFDLSGADPSITLTNSSTAANPANLKWIFEITSPSGYNIHKGDFASPDVNGAWTIPFVKSSGFPKPAGIPELGFYKIVVTVRDLLGNDFSLEKMVNVCRPAGNKLENKNLFGAAIHKILTKCATSQLFVEDKSSYSYQGITGTPLTRTFKLFFPADETGTEPAPFEADPFAGSALISLPVNGEGFRTFQSTVMDYDLGNLVTIRLKYVGRSTFAVHCNLDLGILGCDIQKLIDSIENGTCDNQQEAEEKLRLINPLMATALIGVLSPQSCIDPWEVVEKIKKIGGFTCDCTIRSSGQSATGVVTGTGPLVFNINKAGDIEASWSIVDSTVTLNISSNSYVFKMCDGYAGTAFTVTPSTDGYVKTYCLNVNITQLATEVLNAIQNSTTLMNQLISIINGSSGAGSGKVNVDPGCLSSELQATTGTPGTATTYTATFNLTGLGQIKINTIGKIESDGKLFSYSINYFFDKTNLAAMNDHFAQYEGIYGKFVGTYDSGTSILTMTSTDNPFNLTDFKYTTYSDTSFTSASIVDLSKTAQLVKGAISNEGAYDIEDVLQAIINWICGIGACAIKTGQAFEIKSLLSLAGEIQKISTSADDKLCAVVGKLIEAHNSLVTLYKSLPKFDCDGAKQVFVNTITGDLPTSTSFYGVADGKCSVFTLEQIAKAVMDMAKNNTTVKDALCAAAANCNKVVCAAISNVLATFAAGTVTVDITNTTTAVKYRVGYRLIGDSNTSLVGVKEVTAAAGATTSTTFTSVASGNYEVVVVPVCTTGEGPAYTATTGGCQKPSSFSVVQSGTNFVVTFVAPGTPDHVVLTTEYANGNQVTKDYAANSSPITIPIPSGTSGNVKFTLNAACDAYNKWLSDSMGPVVVNVPATGTCSQVVSPAITAVTDTTMTVTAEKPVVAIAPQYYVLRVSEWGGAVKTYTNNAAGSTLTWNITGLSANKKYSVEIQSVMQDGSTCIAPVGVVTTQPSTSANTYCIYNDGVTNATQVQIFVDDALGFYDPAIAAGGSQCDFLLPPYANPVSVKLVICDVTLTTATIISSGITYNATLIEGGTAYFNNVIINGNTEFRFS